MQKTWSCFQHFLILGRLRSNLRCRTGTTPGGVNIHPERNETAETAQFLGFGGGLYFCTSPRRYSLSLSLSPCCFFSQLCFLRLRLAWRPARSWVQRVEVPGGSLVLFRSLIAIIWLVFFFSAPAPHTSFVPFFSSSVRSCCPLCRRLRGRGK